MLTRFQSWLMSIGEGCITKIKAPPPHSIEVEIDREAWDETYGDKVGCDCI